MRAKEFLREYIEQRFYVIHPGYVESDQIAIRLTDVPNIEQFYKMWDDVPDAYHAEFGYDGPVWDKKLWGPYPKKRIKMSFVDYLTLIDKHMADEANESKDSNTGRCKKCGEPHTPGGYAHPTLCYHCAPVGVSQAKIKRNLRDKKPRKVK